MSYHDNGLNSPLVVPTGYKRRMQMKTFFDRLHHPQAGPSSFRTLPYALLILILIVALLPALSVEAQPAQQTTTLALSRPVTCSSTENAGTACANAVDGNATGTRWSSAFSDPQWIYVDLGATYNISRVVLIWEAAYGTAYQVQFSAAAAGPWTTIFSTTTGNGATDDLTGLTGSGRYVRMNGTARSTQYGYSLWEFQVYGAPGGATNTPTNTTAAPTPPPTTTPPGPTRTPSRPNTPAPAAIDLTPRRP